MESGTPLQDSLLQTRPMTQDRAFRLAQDIRHDEPVVATEVYAAGVMMRDALLGDTADPSGDAHYYLANLSLIAGRIGNMLMRDSLILPNCQGDARTTQAAIWHALAMTLRDTGRNFDAIRQAVRACTPQ